MKTSSDIVNNPKATTILLILGTFFWGMTFVIVKEIVSVMGVFAFLGIRFLIAGAVIFLIFHRRFVKIDKKAVFPGIVIGIVLSAAYASQTTGLKYTTASKAGFITGLSVILVPIIVSAIRRKFPSLQAIIAVVVSFAGLIVITGGVSMNFNRGDLWVLLCAVLYAMHIVLVGIFSVKYDAFVLSFLQVFTTGIICTSIALMAKDFSMPFNWGVIGGIVFCALFATAFIFTIQNRFQQNISETKTAIIFSFEPVFAALGAFLYLNEKITWGIVIGGIMIFAGMIIADLKIKTRISQL